MEFERHHSAWIATAAITVASFVGATAYTQNRLVRLDALSSTIETNAVPSIEHLSRTALRLTRLNQLLDDVGSSGPRRVAALTAARQEVAGLNADVDQYLRLSPLPGEQRLWAELRTDVTRVVQMADPIIGDDRNKDAPSEPPSEQVGDALDAALRSVVAALNFDVQQAEDMARDVRAVRGSTLRMIVELDALSTLIAIAAVAFAFRATRRHDRLVSAHHALLADRVLELDRFTGRVAHDVLSPLGTIAAGLSLLERSCDERARAYIERSRRALHRVQQLVDDLLAFARAGANPDPAVTCSLHAVLDSLIADLSELAAECDVELIAEVQRPITVPCSPGVITSIVQNLVRNGIKYMGERPTRRIVVRALTVDRVARLEVEDTGPGIPPSIESTLFEPFVRGPHEQVSGTGLGLATVKRLVESHRGSIGVESRIGVGSLFRVELPLSPVALHDTSRTVEPHLA